MRESICVLWRWCGSSESEPGKRENTIDWWCWSYWAGRHQACLENACNKKLHELGWKTYPREKQMVTQHLIIRDFPLHLFPWTELIVIVSINRSFVYCRKHRVSLWYNNLTKDTFSHSLIFFLFLDSRRHEPLHFLVKFAQLFEVSGPAATEHSRKRGRESGQTCIYIYTELKAG